MPYEFTPYARIAAIQGMNLFPPCRTTKEVIAAQGLSYSDNGVPGGVLVIDADLHVVTAIANLAVEMRCGQLRPSIALGKQPYCAKSVRGTSVARNVAVYVTAGTDRPNVTSTISGGTPRRNGTMLQPRPPETMTSQLVRVWP